MIIPIFEYPIYKDLKSEMELILYPYSAVNLTLTHSITKGYRYISSDTMLYTIYFGNTNVQWCYKSVENRDKEFNRIMERKWKYFIKI